MFTSLGGTTFHGESSCFEAFHPVYCNWDDFGGLAQEPITSYNTSYISEIMMMDGAFLLHHHLVESSVFLPSRNVDVATESLPSSILTHLHSGMDQRSHVDRFPISTTKKSKSHIAR